MVATTRSGNTTRTDLARDVIRFMLESSESSCQDSSRESIQRQVVTIVYGLIAKLTTLPGKREDFIPILVKSSSRMSGCFSYVVAKDADNENVLWVTEVWDSEANHAASLSLPEVKTAILRARTLVAAFERVAVTSPVQDMGLGFPVRA